MAEERLINEIQKDEFHQIMELINSNENFLLSGGAGSGKTYSLVQVIKQVLTSNPTVKVACITYTNAAVKEIEERVNHKNLNVSTIHDFLWDNIKHFQKELKESLIALFNDEDVKQLKIEDLTSVPSDYYENREEPVSIQYKEYLKLRDGIISHDELLILSEYMFRKYWKLCDIVSVRTFISFAFFEGILQPTATFVCTSPSSSAFSSADLQCAWHILTILSEIPSPSVSVY